jgi:hypothetical protein
MCVVFIKRVAISYFFWFGLIKNLCALNFRRKIAVQYIESSDSEDIETNELPQKMKGNV